MPKGETHGGGFPGSREVGNVCTCGRSMGTGEKCLDCGYVGTADGHYLIKFKARNFLDALCGRETEWNVHHVDAESESEAVEYHIDLYGDNIIDVEHIHPINGKARWHSTSTVHRSPEDWHHVRRRKEWKAD